MIFGQALTYSLTHSVSIAVNKDGGRMYAF